MIAEYPTKSELLELLPYLTKRERAELDRLVPKLPIDERASVEQPTAPPLTFPEFVQGAWRVVEPATVFVPNWHIDLIGDYLAAIMDGKIRNLIINIPPRHAKSLLVSVFFPTWVWTFAPAKRFLCASYAQELAVRDALKSRRIIQSAWYQREFGKKFQLTGDQNVKARYENDKTGYRISTGVGGVATGEGGDILICDDLLKADDADSDTMREGANQWYDGTMSTRGNDPKTVVNIVIMQRLHDDDVTGHIVEKMKEQGADQYELLVLPAEYEPQRFFSSIGKSDLRTEEGELLWEARFGEKELAALKTKLGPRGTAGQLQQRPAPLGGGIFKSAWWNGKNRFSITDPAHKNLVIARWLSFDTASKDKDVNDPSARVVFELQADYHLTTREVWSGRLQEPQLLKEVQDQAEFWNRDGKLRGVIIEDKSSGIGILQTMQQLSEPWLAALLEGFEPKGSKEYRMRLAAIWCERDCVLLPYPDNEAPWLMDFESDLYKAPAIKFDDVYDAFAQGIIYLEKMLAAGWHARNPMVMGV